jgi:CelD/BcsL family acetyltransferase involved in cellulose biosynthesis
VRPGTTAADVGQEGGYCAHIISDLAGMERLRNEWDHLFGASPTASPPLRWEWVHTWWRVYGPVYGNSGRDLRVLTVRRDGQLVGVLPLYLGRKGLPLLAARRLGFVATGAAEFEETGCDYLDLLYAPGEAPGCLEAVRDAIFHAPLLHWDELEFSDLANQSPLLSLTDRRGRPFGRVVLHGTGYRSDLADGFESYLGRLSAGARGEARRLLREVRRTGMVFEVASTVDQAELFFTQMVDLHHRRWEVTGRKGSFAPRHAEFHRALVRSLVPSGSAFLVRLSHAGQPFAVAYGQRVRGIYHCLQRGVALQTQPVRSPGTATLLLLMAHLAEQGVTCYDHLMGGNPFKERYATAQYTLVRLQATRPTARSLMSGFASYVERGVRKVIAVTHRGAKSANRPAPAGPSSKARPLGLAPENRVVHQD